MAVDQDEHLTTGGRERAFPYKYGRRATVPVSTLLPADSPRSQGEDEEHIHRLAESEAELPPILVQRSTMRVIDGMHRLRAAILNGQPFVEIEFFDGDEEEAFIRAVEQNTVHGLPLTLADRRAAAARILGFRPGLSDRSVASVTGLSPKTVGVVRARLSEEIPRLDTRQGRDGRLRPLDGSERRLRAAEVIRENPDASLREVAASVGISPETARRVKAQLRAGDDPARNCPQPGRTVNQPAEKAGSATGSSATAHASSPGPRNSQPTDEISSILQKLSRDPALRHSETDRRLLQTVYAKTIDGAAQAVLTQEIPPHCRPLLARLARYNARIWKEIANEIDRKSRAE